MYRYWAYGLNVHSEIELPELTVSEAPSVDISIFRRERITALDVGEIDDGRRFLGRVDKVGRFGLIDGRTIFVQSFEGVESSFLRTVILGPILSIALRQRGLNVLHAGCVVVNNTAVLFIGRSGAGKSTVTASFYERGHRVIADDLVPVKMENDVAMVSPGYPQIKLHEDAAQVLYENADELPTLHRSKVRRLQNADRNFSREACPVTKIYFLDYGDDIRIEPLDSKEAFGIVMQNTRAIPPLSNSEMIKARFAQCSELVQRVPVARLQRPKTLDLLPELVTRIEQDIDTSVDSRSINVSV